MDIDKIKTITSRLIRFRTLNDSDIDEVILWLNVAIILIEEDGSNLPRGKDTNKHENNQRTKTRKRLNASKHSR